MFEIVLSATIVLNIIIILMNCSRRKDRNKKLETIRKLTEFTPVVLERTDQHLISGRGRGVLVVCKHHATIDQYNCYQYQWIDKKWQVIGIALDHNEVYNWFHRDAVSSEAVSRHDEDRIYFILDLMATLFSGVVLIYSYLN